MTPDEQLALIEVEKERRRRANLAKPSGESEGEDDGAGEDEGFFERKSRELDSGMRSMRGADRDLGEIGARGATLGFDDVAAGLGAKAGVLSGGGSPAEAQAAYDEAVAERRKVVADAKARTGGVGTAAEVAGALATAPLSAAGAIGRGAAVKASPYVANALPRIAQAAKNAARVLGPAAAAGGVAGVGFGDSDTLPDAAKDAAKGAALGGAIAGAAPAAGRLAGIAVDKAKGAVGGMLGKAGQRADELRVLTTAGATGGSIAAPKVLEEAARVPGGVPAAADVLRKSGISSGVTTTKGINERATAAFSSSGKDIGRIIDEATDAGGFVDTAALVGRLRGMADEATSGLTGVSRVNVAEQRKLQAIADEIEKLAPASATPAEIKALSVALGKEGEQGYRAAAAGRPVVGQQEAIRGARREVEGTIPGVLDELGLDSSAYQTAKTLNQTSRIARDASEKSLGRADKNNIFSLGDMAAGGGAGAATGNPLAAGAALLARKTIGPFSASLRATTAEQARGLAQRLLSSPSFTARAGQGAELLRRAAGGPPQVLAQTHDQLMATDPAYRDAVRDEEFRAAVAGTPDDMRRARGSIAP